MNVEGEEWRDQEKIGGGSAKHNAKHACSEPTDQRRDNDSGKERNVFNAHNVGIDGDPQPRCNPST
jgi:hypothetical protein